MTQNSIILWCTGMSGSGKTTLSSEVEKLLLRDGLRSMIIDGDEKRKSDNKKLSFSKKDIIENNLSISNRCKTIRSQFDIIFVSVITPYSETRELIKKDLSPNCKIVYMKATLDSLISRDTKGLYKQAKSGTLDNLIGFSPSNPYEPPLSADLTLETSNESNLSSNIKTFYKFIKKHLDEDHS